MYGTPDKFKATWPKDDVEPVPVPPSAKTIAVDGYWGKDTTRRLQEIFGTPVDGIVSDQPKIHKSKNPGLVGGWEWSDKPKNGSKLIKAIQRKVVVDDDGFIGPETIKGLQAWMGTEQDGFISSPSALVKALQIWCNNNQ